MLALAPHHAPPVVTRNVYAAGQVGRDMLSAHIEAQRANGRYSEHDALIASELATVLCGDGAPGLRDEQTVLDQEAAAFVRLIATPATQACIRHMLTHGKPLRN